MILYTLQPGDTVFALAQRYGVSAEDILQDNQIDNPQRLRPGQTLIIPVAYWEYYVTPGQSLYQIAEGFGVPLSLILEANPDIQNPALIQINQMIRIPTSSVPKRGIDVNGYAYPTIAPEILENTLPFLTYLSIFSYEAQPDGSLSTIDDTDLIALAKSAGVAPMMVLTNLASAGRFDSDLAGTILSNPSLQDTLLDHVEAVLEEKGYWGLDIDFEYVYENQREAYNAFLRRAATRLRPQGYHLSTAVAPKLRADQPGRLYEAHDYPVHGAFMDRVIIMTYEWGYLYGPPMAVAPIGPVRQVLDYAVSAIPAEKILMGMPNYGYDWTLPYVQGTPARSISNLQALEIAQRYGADIQYDVDAQSPYFFYYDEQGRRHVVWFDDARSIQARLQLVEEYGLAGVSYWTIDNFFLPNWLVLTSMYRVNKVL